MLNNLQHLKCTPKILYCIQSAIKKVKDNPILISILLTANE